MVNGQRSTVNGQWTMDNGQWSMDIIPAKEISHKNLL